MASKGSLARLHTGVIAQEVEVVLENHGLDRAFFTQTAWWEFEGKSFDTFEEAPDGAVEVSRKGIRYPELLCFIAAGTEVRLTEMEARLQALEDAMP